MTRLGSMKATLVFSLALLATALPQAGFAANSDVGVWKVDPAKSKFNSGFATITIERSGGVNPAAGSFILISKGSVYLMTGAAASDIKGVKQVDYTGMMRDGKAVLIGTNARSADYCGFRCQSGLPDNRVTLTFKAVEGKGPQINDMLALGGPKQ